MDLNIEVLMHVLKEGVALPPSDTWTRRALRHLPEHLQALRSWKAYQDIDSYRRCVQDIHRIVSVWGKRHALSLSLVDCEDPNHSPLRSQDLLAQAEAHEAHPFMPFLKTRLVSLVETFSPDTIGISLNTLSQALCAFAITGFLKARFPGIRLWMGGGLITSWMRNPGWKNPFSGLIDRCVAGPGEQALLQEAGMPDGTDPGFLPDYSDLWNEDLLAPGRILPFSGSIGCSWRRCRFCPERSESNPQIQFPEERVIETVRGLCSETTPVLVHWVDSTLSPRLLEGLAQRGLGTPWYGFARVTPSLQDPEFCETLRKSGCVLLKLGLESGDDSVLNALNKGLRVAQSSRALKALHQAGIATYVYLLFGTPAETLGAARQTLEFTAEHSEMIDFLNLSLFNLPVGSEEAFERETRPFYQGDLSLYEDFQHPEGWDRKSVRAFLDGEFRRHPAIAPILRRQPPYFTSNHAPFFSPTLSRAAPGSHP